MRYNADMARMFIFGCGYTGGRLAQALLATGWQVDATGGGGEIAFADENAVRRALKAASHVLSSVPPTEAGDPVLDRYGDALGGKWLSYLSSTGVYGDTGGAWADEAAPVGGGRRSARAEADGRWRALGATVFRLPGIYGPGRSALDQVRAGTARRVDRPGHRFSRIHVADIAGAVVAAAGARATGVFNVVDNLPAEPRHVTEFACNLLGRPWPPLTPVDLAGLSPMARAFWTERRCVAGARLERETGYRLRHPDYKAGLTAILAGERP